MTCLRKLKKLKKKGANYLVNDNMKSLIYADNAATTKLDKVFKNQIEKMMNT